MAEELVSAIVPDQLKPAFIAAEKEVKKYFSREERDVTKGILTISGNRYLHMAASALTGAFRKKLADIMGDESADAILYDLGKEWGKQDAKYYHKSMGLENATPDERLGPGPIIFNYQGIAFVHLLEGSHTSPDENYYLIYNHPHSFEMDTFVENYGKTSKKCVCVIGGGYSTGWCSESYRIELDAVEITCRARGEDACLYIMAPPEKVRGYVEDYCKKHGLDHEKANFNVLTE